MKYIKLQPFDSILDGDRTPCAIWRKEKSDSNLCEFNNDEKTGECDISGIYYGTDDSREPKFCARHFYQYVTNGNGKSNYKIIDAFDMDETIEMVSTHIDKLFKDASDRHYLVSGDFGPAAEDLVQTAKELLVDALEEYITSNKAENLDHCESSSLCHSLDVIEETGSRIKDKVEKEKVLVLSQTIRDIIGKELKLK